MKKLITYLLCLLLTVQIFAGEKYSIPDFEESDKAIIFDATTLDHDYGDYCKFINLTDYCNISFDLYGMRANKKHWYHIGEANLNGLFDEDKLETNYDHNYDMFRFFAIVPKDEDNYEIEMRSDKLFLGIISTEYLVFCVKYAGPEPDIRYRENAAIIEVNKIPGHFEDNVKIVNNTFDRGIQIIIYGFDNKDDEIWEPLGTAFLKKIEDEDFVETPLFDNPFPKRRYYAVVSVDGTKYDVRCYKHHDDLYIELN